MAPKKPKDTPASDPMKNSIGAADELRQFIERFEALEADKKSITDEQKEVMSEAKGRGYDTKIMRRIIAERKRDKDDLAEEEAILELYREALGMYIGLGGRPDEDDEEADNSMV